jgi:pre-mRNA-splicing helicase BRR2
MVQGFEEIHVPALKPKPFAKNERIVKIKELPAWMHPAFEGMDALNRIQSRVCYESLIIQCAAVQLRSWQASAK